MKTDEDNKKKMATVVVFWILTALAVLVITFMLISSFGDDWLDLTYVFIPAILMSVSGITLIILAAKSGINRLPRSFLILTGSSAAAMTIGAVLHNLLYALMVYLSSTGLFGLPSDFDEPFFLILALVIAPIGLLAGIIGSIVLIYSKKLLFDKE